MPKWIILHSLENIHLTSETLLRIHQNPTWPNSWLLPDTQWVSSWKLSGCWVGPANTALIICSRLPGPQCLALPPGAPDWEPCPAQPIKLEARAFRGPHQNSLRSVLFLVTFRPDWTARIPLSTVTTFAQKLSCCVVPLLRY